MGLLVPLPNDRRLLGSDRARRIDGLDFGLPLCLGSELLLIESVLVLGVVAILGNGDAERVRGMGGRGFSVSTEGRRSGIYSSTSILAPAPLTGTASTSVGVGEASWS